MTCSPSHRWLCRSTPCASFPPRMRSQLQGSEFSPGRLLSPTEHISLSLDIPCRRHYPGRSDGNLFARTFPSSSAFPVRQVGRLLHQPFRGLLSVYSRYGLHARRVANAIFYTEGFSSFVASATASIATGWSEPVPARGIPAVDHHLFTAVTRPTRSYSGLLYKSEQIQASAKSKV